MKSTVYLLIVFISFLTGCRFADDDNINCINQSPLEGVEFIVFNNDQGFTRLFNTFSEQAQTLYLGCENIEIPSNVGVDSIFSVYGTYISDCNSGTCIEIDSLVSPICSKPYAVDSSVVTSIYSSWDVIHVVSDGNLLEPSCVQPGLTLDFDKDAAESIDYPDQALGLVGANSTSFNFRLNGDTIFSQSSVITQALGQPYVQRVEDAIVDIVTEDTILYKISYNTLILKPIGRLDSVLLSL